MNKFGVSARCLNTAEYLPLIKDTFLFDPYRTLLNKKIDCTTTSFILTKDASKVGRYKRAKKEIGLLEMLIRRWVLLIRDWLICIVIVVS